MKKTLFYIAALCFLTAAKTNVKAQNPPINDPEAVFEAVEQKQILNQEKTEAAFAAMELVEMSGAWIESLNELMNNSRLSLPVGIEKGGYALIIHKTDYNEKTEKPVIHATCAFKLKKDGQPVAFAGTVELEGKNGTGPGGYLELIAPVRQNLGKKVALIFREGTRLSFGCRGVESFRARIDLFVTSENIIPVDEKGNPAGKSLSSSFDAVFADFEHYTASFRFDQSFTFRGLKDMIFTLNGATFDHSDMETNTMVKFPENYFSGAVPEEKELWQGIAITEASLSLPSVFKKPHLRSGSDDPAKDTSPGTMKDRITIGVKNALIDENGFSGEVKAGMLIGSESLDRSKWTLSLHRFSLMLSKDKLQGFGFAGDVNIPPLGKSSLLAYTATINPAINEYEFKVNLSGNFELPVLKSELSLNENSYVEILFKDSGIYPVLNACGKLSVNAPVGKNKAEEGEEEDNSKRFILPDIRFENLKISREEPYLEIGTVGLAGDLKTPEIAGFGLQISNIHSFNDSRGSGLSFDAGVKLNEKFGGDAGLQLYGDYARWKFDRVGIDKVHVAYKSGAFSVEGGIWFKNGDEIYGTGFRGDIAFELLEKFKFDAVLVMGKKDDYRYFLTDVFMELSPPAGITIPPALLFYGFGGGLYRKMQQSYDPAIDSEFGKALSGINYVPDKSVGLGFMCATKFGFLASPALFNAKVGFEIQFNRHGGLNFVQLRGDASMMAPDKWGKLADNVSEKVKKLERAGSKIKPAQKTDLKEPENRKSGFLTASMNIKFDFANKVYTADLSAYLNAGVIKGTGPGNRMGWASAYFSRDKWYTYIGTPRDRMGVDILGLAKIDGYFMTGADIPELPPPPAKVLRNFSQSARDRLTYRSDESVTAGNGLAFGQSFSLAFKAVLPPFYAGFGMGMGGEFLLKNYGTEAYCAGGNTTIGINGWYARAQAWAWVEAGIGMEARVFGSKKRFEILDISAGALLAGAGPNPLYFTGAVGGRFSALGGLVSGECEFEFEIGQECKIVGGSPFGQDIIAQVTPAEGGEDVNVFAAPQAVFNIPVEKVLKVEEADGLFGWYKITLERFEIFYKKNKQRLKGHFELSPDGKVYMLDPDEPFESQEEMIVYAKVGLMRKLNGGWIHVKDDKGKPLFESKEASFRSGDRPKTIMPAHVKFSYPAARQYNFYPDEYDKGYIMVSENYSYLFSSEKPEGYEQILSISDPDGLPHETKFTYTTHDAGNDIRLVIDYSMKNAALKTGEIYCLAIMNKPVNQNINLKSNIRTTQTRLDGNEKVAVNRQEAEGTLDLKEEKEIYALHFRTSRYRNFDEKIAGYNIKGNSGWRDRVESFVHHIKHNVTDNEFFDKNEIQWQNGDAPMVQFEAQLDKTDWFTRSVYKSMYAACSVESIEKRRNETDSRFGKFGYPPAKAVFIENNENDKVLTDSEIKTGSAKSVFPYGLFTYALPYWCSRDFYIMKRSIAKKFYYNKPLTKEEEKLLAEDHPPVVTKGKYPVIVKYVLPGKNITTSAIPITMYNPVYQR